MVGSGPAGALRLEGARLTPCDCAAGAPSWELRSESALVHPGERVELTRRRGLIAAGLMEEDGFMVLAGIGLGTNDVPAIRREVDGKAVKVIRDGALAGPRELARFRIEAEAAARTTSGTPTPS